MTAQPFGGTKITGYVPTVQSDGSVTWAAGGGGGGVPALSGHGDPTGGTAIPTLLSHTAWFAVETTQRLFASDVIDVRIQKSTVSGTGILNNDGEFTILRVN